ncbi:CHASE2 domain-containing protein [Parasphingopyxis sp.]|uniref:CHASE2 domain-containing protein n=1 Tax=Parasphingopyxis sp. TaxID=1920299 RepID=UPI0026280AD4|nr:CHASE2 domain-containing protein [Parasphingopyxis sp.]
MADTDTPAANGLPDRDSLIERWRRARREIGPTRFISTVILLLIALFVARYSWVMPFTDEIERVLFDVRASYAMEQVEEDERILIVVYDEDTLIDTGVRSPLDREILAQALANIDAMNPEAVAIDIIIDQATPNDALLVDTLRAMTNRTYVPVVTPEHSPQLELQPRQIDFLADFVEQTDTDAVDTTSVVLTADEDNVARSWPIQPDDLPPVIANALAPGYDVYRDHRGSIAYRIPLYEGGAVFTQLPIGFFADPEMAPAFAEFVTGRYVLIGTALNDRDQFETPLSRLSNGATIPGVEVHAHMLAQMLDGVMFKPIPPWILWLTALIVILCAALTSLLDLRLWKLALLTLIQAAFILVIPFTLHRNGIDTQMLPVFGWIAGWIIAFMTVGAAARSVGAEKREYVQGALNKYLPSDVATQIMDDPERLTLRGEKRAIYAVFTDLEGFTKLSHAIEPEMVARLLNNYLDKMSEIVLDYGGTIDKFVGDAVVAFWGAPIARSDDADRAAQCAIAMWRFGEEFRHNAPDGVPPIGRTRVGLHYGEAIVGNFGGEERIQYTALGDAMNTAARLESANKQTDTVMLASYEAVERVTKADFRCLGRVTLSGRATPVKIYEPVLEITAGSAALVDKLFREYEEGDEQAREKIAELAAENPDDAALQNFANRLITTEPGGTYVLQGK